jgi:hypothetical protein
VTQQLRIAGIDGGYRVWTPEGDFLGDVLRQAPTSRIPGRPSKAAPWWLPIYQGKVTLPLATSRRDAINALMAAASTA